MGEAAEKPGESDHGASPAIDFRTEPARYRHWKLTTEGDVATLTMDVDEKGGLLGGYELKLNSYDLGVDIELADAIERLRFEHPEVSVVILKSGKDRVFCAGANIRMLASATHAHKVNFCKFTNETRNGIEDASENSGQKYLCVVNGTAAGGGYELALACDHIMLVDDGSATVSLPELPLLAVLPGTGGLTRVTDKRKVRRDHADVFCTTEEGVKGKRAVDWRLVDEVMPRSKLDESVASRAKEFAAHNNGKPAGGIALTPVERNRAADCKRIQIRFCRIHPREPARNDHAAWARGCSALLRGRHGETGRGVLAAANRARTGRRDPRHPAQRAGDRDHRVQVRRRRATRAGLRHVSRCEHTALARARNPPEMEARAQARRHDLALDSGTDRPGSCFAGTLAELIFAADRSYMLIGTMQGDNSAPAAIMLGDVNFNGGLTMSNGLTRIETRFLDDDDARARAQEEVGCVLEAEAAEEIGLVTFALDDIDWDDEVRLFLEERASFSPDGLTGMEANLRFAGPETMETKIFARLTAWQNWIFQRPNAVGPEGALTRYGSGQKPNFDLKRV